MLHILCLILKIVCIILFCTLAFVLFVPIRYRLNIESENSFKDLKVEARATWLFHLAYASAFYEKENMVWKLRVGWKKYHADEKAKEKKESKETETDWERKGNVKESKKPVRTDKKDKTENTSEKTVHKLTYTIRKICDKIKEIKAFLTEETHVQAFLRLKKEFWFLLKKTKPDKMKGYLRFGLADPYDTGRVLAGLSVLYPIYGDCVQIYPEFEHEVLEGHLLVKGRIHVIHLLVVFLRVYWDKNVRTAYRHFQNRKE